MKNPSPDMWLGLKRCGCPVAACVDTGKSDDVEKSKAEFLGEGLQVIVVTWAQWRETWMHKFREDCEHDAPKELVLTNEERA